MKWHDIKDKPDPARLVLLRFNGPEVGYLIASWQEDMKDFYCEAPCHAVYDYEEGNCYLDDDDYTVDKWAYLPEVNDN